MLTLIDFTTNNTKFYNNFSSPIKKVTHFNGKNKDSVELSTNNQNDKKISQKEKTKQELIKIGFSKEDYNQILNTNDKYLVNPIEGLKYITKDIPDISDKNLKQYFVTKRIESVIDPINQNDEVSDTKYVINKDKFKFFNKMFNKFSQIQTSESIEDLSSITNVYDTKTLKKIDKFIDKDENAPVLLTALNVLDFNKEQKALTGAKKLLNAGYSKNIMKILLLPRIDNEEFDKSTQIILTNADKYCNLIDSLKKWGINPKFAILISAATQDVGEIKQVSDFLDDADKHKTELGSTDAPVEDIELLTTFVSPKKASKTAKTIDILGKDNLIKMFPLGLDTVGSVVEALGDKKVNDEHIEPLIEIINPTDSIRYMDAQDKINIKKNKFKTVSTNDERQKLIKDIADATTEKNSLLKLSLKDPKAKADAIKIYVGLIKNNGRRAKDYENANMILPYFKENNVNNKELNKKLSTLVWDKFYTLPTEKTKEKINLKNDNHIQKLIFTDDNFVGIFSSLIDTLNQEPNKSVKATLDDLPQNQTLKKKLDKYNINYDVWTGRNTDLDIRINIEHNFDKMSKNAIKNLNAEFNDEIFKSLPEKQKQNLAKRLASGGYKLHEAKSIEYEGDGFYAGTKQELRLFKDNKPIEFKDLSKIYKLINTEFSTNKYWDTNNSYETIETAKETFKDHISTRHEEMKRIRQYQGSDNSDITIKKVDMNDISHSLFLGNDSSCCTAIGSFNDWTAPNYIKNKMVQAIELTDGNEPIGNSMMYLIATASDNQVKPALLIDNIELKPKYQYNDKLEDGIIKYCKNFCKMLGRPDMDIYAGPNRHKLNMDNFEISNESFQMFGDTYGDPIYLDFVTQGIPVDYNSWQGDLLKLKPDNNFQKD